MRISDWSSDVCSSELDGPRCPRHLELDGMHTGPREPAGPRRKPGSRWRIREEGRAYAAMAKGWISPARYRERAFERLSLPELVRCRAVGRSCSREGGGMCG